MPQIIVSWGTSGPSRERIWLRRGLTLLTVAAVFWVFWSVRGALLPFIVGAILAYLLTPLVNLFEHLLPSRRRFPGPTRTLAILLTYAVALVTLAGISFLFVPPLVRQTNEFIQSAPEYWSAINEQVNDWLAQYQANVPPSVRAQSEGALGYLWSMALQAFQRAMRLTFGAVGAAIGFFSAVVLVPFWMYYVLKDSRRAVQWFYGLWPEGWRPDVQAVVQIVDRTLAAYIRGQLFLGLIIGVAVGVAMWVIGITQPIVLGLIAGVLELVPILGPILTFIVIALVALATDPNKLVWVGLAFIVIQQLENNLLVPRVHGYVVEMNPAVVMVLVVTGGALWGVPGMIVAVPLAAVARDVFRYFYRRWSNSVSVPSVLSTVEVADESSTSSDP
ncbi:AI-2E family transporter [Thermomicrobium sp. 4228-Ro]|uniref:AI-2E family transporter n=1 Tax=Thermomicrobium sp. 4228-Ro TaxID=2993937 RepID=UPI0022499226|nr:AI-2E family transporter [Thermomicrobium sp. 4228-Ro]MCX2726048.1 AI-2E family transporter [Thermomicrobium sp. 4228-Ro]